MLSGSAGTGLMAAFLLRLVSRLPSSRHRGGFPRRPTPMHVPLHDASAIYRPRDCLAAVDCLCCAIVHLDFFSVLERHPDDLPGICRRLGLHPRPADVMLTLFKAHGFVEADGDGVHRTTGLAREVLVAGGPCDARPYYASMAERPGVADFLRVLRTGRPANWPGEEGEADWHAAMRTEAFAESFTAAMDCRGRAVAPALAGAVDLGATRRLLDVGGGSGVYATACAETWPALEAVVLEAPPVDAIARRVTARSTAAARIAVVAADMFADPWPADCDVHLFSNVLHDWDEPDCRRLLAASARALPRGGRILVHDMFLDDDKAGPAWAAEYSVLLSTVTQGRLYARAEVAGFAADVGFSPVRHAQTALGRGVLELAR